jgi:hypothetical protein
MKEIERQSKETNSKRTSQKNIMLNPIMKVDILGSNVSLRIWAAKSGTKKQKLGRKL